METAPRAASSAGLVAVLLIIRSRPGPRLVFYYPASAESSSQQQKVHEGIDSDDSGSDSGIEDKLVSTTAADDPPFPDTGKFLWNNAEGVNSHTLLGHSVESLEKLLSPGRWCDRKKFEVCVNDLTFVGHPIYAAEAGNWSGKRNSKDEESHAVPSSAARTAAKYGDHQMHLEPGNFETAPHKQLPNRGKDTISDRTNDFMHIPESLESEVERTFATSMESSSTASGIASEHMEMFHIVFVLEAQGREVGILYGDMVKPLSLALHYSQKQSNYVTVESRKLLACRAKSKQLQTGPNELWTQMVETSELAWALKEVYEQISVAQMANIRLNGMEMSLMCGDMEDHGHGEQILEPLSALLLLESKGMILHQIAHPDTSPLAQFIRGHTPTKNLQKHSVLVGMSIDDILYLASHLVKWRKARIILPLHQRNTYTIHPDAPLKELRGLSNEYTTTFSTLPSLPNMIKILSGKPIKYINLIPSRDHRGVYMDILAFLFRHNFVVQLRTYGWLRLPKNLSSTSSGEADPIKRPQFGNSLLSPRLRPVDDDAESVSSERTAVAPVSMNRANKRISTGTQITATSHSPNDGTLSHEFAIITNPQEPSEEEAKLIAALTTSLENEEMKDVFPSIIKYLDGEHAFEEIAARQGLKRSKVEEWLSELEKKGWLMVVRYI